MQLQLVSGAQLNPSASDAQHGPVLLCKTAGVLRRLDSCMGERERSTQVGEPEQDLHQQSRKQGLCVHAHARHDLCSAAASARHSMLMGRLLVSQDSGVRLQRL